MQHLQKLFLRIFRIIGPISSLDGAIQSTMILKNWVENNKGWVQIQNAPDGQKEKAIQSYFCLGAAQYLRDNNLDLSCEANEGPGPVDHKISRGNDKTVIEMKLSSNDQYIHGYEKQIWRYAQAENTEKMVYILIDVGNEERVEKLRKRHEQRLTEGKKSPILVIIDSKPQKSASKC